MKNSKITTKNLNELSKIKEPDILTKKYEKREKIRNKIYGGLPPEGYNSWGDFWKSY